MLVLPGLCLHLFHCCPFGDLGLSELDDNLVLILTHFSGCDFFFFLGLTFKAPGLLLWLASCRQTSEEKANGFDALKGGVNKFSNEFDCM